MNRKANKKRQKNCLNFGDHFSLLEAKSALDVSKLEIDNSNLLVHISKTKLIWSLRFILFFSGLVVIALFWAFFKIFQIIAMVNRIEISFHLVLSLYMVPILLIYFTYRFGLILLQIYYESYLPVKKLPDEEPLKIPLSQIKEILVSVSKILQRSTYSVKLLWNKNGKTFYVPVPITRSVESQEDIEDLLDDFKAIVKKDYPISWKIWTSFNSIKQLKDIINR